MQLASYTHNQSLMIQHNTMQYNSTQYNSISKIIIIELWYSVTLYCIELHIEHRSFMLSTLASYTDAFNKLIYYAATQHIVLDIHTDYDSLLLNYLHSVYYRYNDTHKSGLALANHTVAAFSHFLPQYKQHIPHTRRALHGYKRLKSSTPHAALPWPAAVMIAIVLASQGRYEIFSCCQHLSIWTAQRKWWLQYSHHYCITMDEPVPMKTHYGDHQML